LAGVMVSAPIPLSPFLNASIVTGLFGSPRMQGFAT
jgi:hypothetical protein